MRLAVFARPGDFICTEPSRRCPPLSLSR